MFTCSSKALSVAFTCLVRPQLEYACQVWNPHLNKDILMLQPFKTVQLRRWILSKWNPNTFTWLKPTKACLQELHWPSLARRQDYLCVAYLFDLLHQRYTLLFNSFCSFKPITFLRAHTLSLQTVGSSYYQFLQVATLILLTFLFYGTSNHLIL